MTQFFEEDACRRYLVRKRWGGKPVCPYCGNRKSYVIEGGKRFKCANVDCHRKFSVTIGTVAEDTNISLSIWFATVLYISQAKEGVSSVVLALTLSIPQKTAWYLLNRIRKFLWKRKKILMY